MFKKWTKQNGNMRQTRELKIKDIATTISASVHSDVGCIREANEDRGLYITPDDAETKRRRGVLTIVADGMGGHASGEVASEMAVELIGKYYYADKGKSATQALKQAIEKASGEIYQTSMTDEKFFGMGTTVIALVLTENKAFSAHVGDSRLYRLRDQKLELMTMDHSQVMEMVKMGIISLEEAGKHDDKNIILRALGTQPAVEAEVSEIFGTAVGDEFLLCSDGLCDMLDDAEIREIWVKSKNVHEACESLIEAAKRRGGHDNVTVGIVGISAENDETKTKAIPQTREMKGLEV